jgi:ribose transport system ATP-binding protein
MSTVGTASTAPDAPAALAVEHLSKAYPGVQALADVSLDVARGEVHGLVGENGAGKSTLIKILAGVVNRDEGRIHRDGEAAEIASAADARRCGLAFIHQELNLIEYFTAPQNVFLGHPMPKRFGLFSREKLKKRTQSIFETLGADVPLSEPVRYLKPEQRAMVAIARAFAHDASVYFMDEPGTALAGEEKRRLFDLIRRLRDRGKSVVYVTHNLEDVLSLADRVTVLREGREVGAWPTETLTRDGLIEAMIGEQAAQKERQGRRRSAGAGAGAAGATEVEAPLLEADELRGNGVGPVSFALRPGEILGIGGLVGAGRTELLRLLYGAARAEAGSLRARGRKVRLRSPAQAVQLGMGFIPEERRSEGLALLRTVLENILPSSLRRFSRAGFVRFGSLERSGRETGRRVKLKAASYRNAVKTLSGGNQQKVVFARALLSRPSILMLDEPTKGVDVGARFEIYELMGELADAGVGLILVSSDLDEMLMLADRILFLRNGRQGATVENRNMDQQQYLRLCYEGATDE